MPRQKTSSPATRPRPACPTTSATDGKREPDLFLVGAPRCGTTALYSWLRQHPEVYCPIRKEPHFHYNPYGQKPLREDYLALYRKAGPEHRHAVDGSVYYLSSPNAIRAIRDEVEDARFIVCLRNPVEMAPSLHWQKIFSGHESIEDFAQAWRLSDIRHAGGFEGIVNLPPEADPRHMAYKQVSSLGRQLADLLNLVPRERVFICFLEDIAGRPGETFAGLCAFLGIARNAEIDLAPRNQAKAPRFPRLLGMVRGLGRIKRRLGIRKRLGIGLLLERTAQVERRYAPPDAELRREMLKTFEADITLLEELTGRSLDHWRTAGAASPRQGRSST